MYPVKAAGRHAHESGTLPPVPSSFSPPAEGGCVPPAVAQGRHTQKATAGRGKNIRAGRIRGRAPGGHRRARRLYPRRVLRQFPEQGGHFLRAAGALDGRNASPKSSRCSRKGKVPPNACALCASTTPKSPRTAASVYLRLNSSSLRFAMRRPTRGCAPASAVSAFPAATSCGALPESPGAPFRSPAPPPPPDSARSRTPFSLNTW